jgi:hypothetical protein
MCGGKSGKDGLEQIDVVCDGKSGMDGLEQIDVVRDGKSGMDGLEQIDVVRDGRKWWAVVLLLCCEHGDERVGFVKCEEFLDQVGNC